MQRPRGSGAIPLPHKSAAEPPAQQDVTVTAPAGTDPDDWYRVRGCVGMLLDVLERDELLVHAAFDVLGRTIAGGKILALLGREPGRYSTLVNELAGEIRGTAHITASGRAIAAGGAR